MLKLSTNKMLNLIISCTRFKRNYSGCTCRSSENLCSSSGGKKKIEGETQESINCLSFTPRLNVDVLLCGYVYESHPMYDQTQGTGAVFSLLYGY